MVGIAGKERTSKKKNTYLTISSAPRITTAVRCTAAVVIASSCTPFLSSVFSSSSNKLLQLALAQYSYETGIYNITLPQKEETRARFEFAVEGNIRAFSAAFLRCASQEESTLTISDSSHMLREGESSDGFDVSILSKGKELAECDGTTKFRRCVVATTTSTTKPSAATTQQVLINCKSSNMSSSAVFNFIKTTETSQSGPICVSTALEIVAGAGYGSLLDSNAAVSYLPLFTSFRLDASVPSTEPSITHSAILSYTLSPSLTLLPSMDSRDVRSTPFYQRSVRRRLLHLDTDPTPLLAREEAQPIPIRTDLSAPTKQTEATPTRLVATSSTTATALKKQTPDAILEDDTLRNITSASTMPSITGSTPTAGKSSSSGGTDNMPSPPPPTVASAIPATRPTADKKSTERVPEMLFCRNLNKHADVVRISERDYFGPSVYPLALELDPSVVRGHPMPARTANTLREAGCEPLASSTSGVLGDAAAVNNGFFIVKRLEIALFAKESRNEKEEEKTQAWSQRLTMPFTAQSASRGKCEASIDFNVFYSKATPENHTVHSLTTTISSAAFVLPVLDTRNGTQSQQHIAIPFELAAIAGSFYSNVSSAPMQHVSASIISGLSTCGRVLRVDNTTVTTGAAATPRCEGVLRIGAFSKDEGAFSSIVYLPFTSADASAEDLSYPSSSNSTKRNDTTTVRTGDEPSNTTTSAANSASANTTTAAASTTKSPVTTESPPLAASMTTGPAAPPKKKTSTTTTTTSTTDLDDWGGGGGGGEDDTNEEWGWGDDNEYGEEWGDEDESSGLGEVGAGGKKDNGGDKAKTTTTRKTTTTASPKKQENIEGKTTTTRAPKTTGGEDDEGQNQEETTKPTTTSRIFSNNYGNTEYQKSGAASIFSSLLTFVFFAVPVACLAYFRRDVAAFVNRLRGYVGIDLNGDEDGSGGAGRRRGAAVGGRARKGSTTTAIQIDRGEYESSSEEDGDERQSIPMKMIRASSSNSPTVVTNDIPHDTIDFSGNNAPASSKSAAAADSSGSKLALAALNSVAASKKKRPASDNLLAEPAITTRPPSAVTAASTAGWDDDDDFFSDAKSDKEQQEKKSKAAASVSAVPTPAAVAIKPLMKPNLAKKNDEVTAPKPSLSLTSKLGAKAAGKDGNGKEDLGASGSGQLALHGSASSSGGGGAMRLGGRVGGLGLGASNRASSAVVAPLKPSLIAKPAVPTSVRSSSAGPQPPAVVSKQSNDAWADDDDLFE